MTTLEQKKLTKEEILEAITEKGWGTNMFGLPEPQTILSPEKLAAFLEKILIP